MRQPLQEREIRAAEILNTSIQLLVSNRVRAEVANSFTRAERNILFRPAVIRRVPGMRHPFAGNWMGTLSVRAMRLTFMVTLSVLHEEPEAAAIVANRYVQQWRAELARSTNFQGISLREIAVATSSPEPVAPNLRRILQGAIGLAVVTFIGLAVVAALLRRLIRIRPPGGPELRME